MRQGALWPGVAYTCLETPTARRTTRSPARRSQPSYSGLSDWSTTRFGPEWRTGALHTAITVLGLLGLLATAAGGQSFFGGVRGEIRDAGGGALPGVTVTLANVETGAARTTVSGPGSEYAFANVQPGTYTLRAELSAFAPFVQGALVIGISSFVVVDTTLAVGGIEETVTVTGAPCRWRGVADQGLRAQPPARVALPRGRRCRSASGAPSARPRSDAL